jgi:hypothetical protein
LADTPQLWLFVSPSTRVPAFFRLAKALFHHLHRHFYSATERAEITNPAITAHSLSDETYKKVQT